MRKRYPPCEKKTFSVREELFHDPRQQPNRGNLTYHAPPCGGGDGGGAAIFCSPPPPYFIKNVNYFLYPNIILTFV